MLALGPWCFCAALIHPFWFHGMYVSHTAISSWCKMPCVAVVFLFTTDAMKLPPSDFAFGTSRLIPFPCSSLYLAICIALLSHHQGWLQINASYFFHHLVWRRLSHLKYVWLPGASKSITSLSSPSQIPFQQWTTKNLPRVTVSISLNAVPLLPLFQPKYHQNLLVSGHCMLTHTSGGWWSVDLSYRNRGIENLDSFDDEPIFWPFKFSLILGLIRFPFISLAVFHYSSTYALAMSESPVFSFDSVSRLFRDYHRTLYLHRRPVLYIFGRQRPLSVRYVEALCFKLSRTLVQQLASSSSLYLSPLLPLFQPTYHQRQLVTGHPMMADTSGSWSCMHARWNIGIEVLDLLDDWS